MADRTVSVKLVADASAYIRGVEDAARKTRESSDQIEQRLAQQQEAYQQVGVAALAVGTIAAAGVVAAVNAYSQFDAAMSNVQAATGESQQNMELLSAAALQAGADTVYSATEAAAAIEELSKAGVSTSDILDGALSGSLDLAAAGEISVAEAAETAASAMTQFGLAGGDVTHIADLLAAAAGNAQGGVSDMGQALSQSGLVASQMGLSIEETTGTLAAFASAGLIGSDAGTSFRAMLLRLANPTGEVRDIMDELGLSFYDAQGQFIGMEGVASQLTTQMADLTQEQRNAALATIFGQDAIRAASILYTEGAEGVAEWTATVNDSGYAAEQAAARLDNLQGDLEALGGAFETLLINLGSSADGPLRGLVQGLDSIVSAAAEAPEELQAVSLAAMGLVAAVGLVGGAALIAIPQVAAFRTALATLGITAASTRAGLAAVTTALGNPMLVAAAAATAAAFVLNDAIEQSKPSVDAWAAALEGGADAADLFAMANQGAFQGFEFDASEFNSLLDSLERVRDNPLATLDPSTWALQMSNFGSSLREVDAALAAADPSVMVEGFQSIVEQYNLSEESAVQLLGEMEGVREELVNQAIAADPAVGAMSELEQTQAAYAIAAGDGAAASEEAASAVQEYAEESQSAAEMAQELLATQMALNDLWFDAQDAAIAYEQSLDDLQAAINEGLSPALNAAGDNFDFSTESGRQAAEMLATLVQNANDNTEAMIANGASAEEVAAYQARARDEIANVANQMDATGAVAATYTNRLNDIPSTIYTRVTVDVGGAAEVLESFVNQRRVAVIEVQAGPTPDIIARNGVATAFAAGGRIPGYAPGYDDRLGHVPGTGIIGLGGGEYIMPTLMTDKYLPMLEAMRTGSLSLTGYADGGRVSSPSYSSSPSVVYVSQPASAPRVTVPVSVAPETDPVIFGRKMGRGVADSLAGVQL